jgi:hypothetical protein
MKEILTLLLLLGSKFGIAQNNYCPAPDSLKSGLYVKSLGKLIPWFTRLEDIHIYGDPKIIKYDKKHTVADWGKVDLLNDISGELTGYFWGSSGHTRMSYIIAYLDSSQVPIVRNQLEAFLNAQGILRGVTKKSYFYEWKLYGCFIRLGLFKTGRYFLWIKPKY